MEIRKTRLLPLDDANEARRIFRELVYDQPYILFVVLGDGPDAESAVSRAGKFAGNDDDPEWVVWARRLDDVRTEIGRLEESQAGFKASVLAGRARAFTTSFGDEIRDVIDLDEAVDNVRVVQAYARAEKSPA